MLQNILKLRNKKGFTLVEVIVVLVIIAILAALLIPALTGYIDKANERRYIAEARMFLLAAQTVISEEYGLTNGTFTDGTIVVAGDGADPETFELTLTGGNNADDRTSAVPATDADDADNIAAQTIVRLAELEAGYEVTTCAFDDNGDINRNTYTFVRGDYTVTFANGAWLCTKT